MATKTTKKFDPRRDEMTPFVLPTLFVVAEIVGPAYPEQQLYVLGGGIYTNREMAEFHAADLRRGDTERLAKAMATLKSMDPVSEYDRRNAEAQVRAGLRDIRVLETGKDAHVRLEVKLGPPPYGEKVGHI